MTLYPIAAEINTTALPERELPWNWAYTPHVSWHRFCIGGLRPPGHEAIDLGPTHPAAAGLLTGTLTLDDDGRVETIDPAPGALHRGAELIFVARDYRQALSLADRHDWQAPFFGEYALARLVEDALGIEVPARARWVRALLAEHTRIASHLAFLTPLHGHSPQPGHDPDPLREELRLRLAELTGNRVHPMAVRIGGVACDPTAAWADAERATVRRAAALARRLAAVADAVGRGVAPVPRHVVEAYGLAGPVARASGVATDLRRAASGSVEALLLEGEAPAAPTTGDASARFAWLAAEVVESASAVERALDGLPTGALSAHLPKVLRLPEGDFHAAVEAPLGRAGVLVTSRGERTPWRLRLRTASAANVSAWASVVPGTREEDLPIALASLPWTPGDLDK